jgi:hypothetical protein
MADHESQERVERDRQERARRVVVLLNAAGLILSKPKPKPGIVIGSFEVGYEDDDVHGFYGLSKRVVHLQADPLRAGENEFWLRMGERSRGTMHYLRGQGVYAGIEESLIAERSEPLNVPYSAVSVACLVAIALTPNKHA